MAGQLTQVRFAITSGQSASSEQDLRSLQLVGLHMPTAWTASNLTFTSRPGLERTNPGNDAHQALVDGAGSVVTVVVGAGLYVAFTGEMLDAVTALAMAKLVSVNPQGADREIIGICAPLGAL